MQLKTAKRQNVKAHAVAVHSEIRFPCHLCDYNAFQRGDLKRHVTVKHLGTKFPCEQCNFQTTSKCYLNINNNLQWFEIYSCDFCDYTGETKGTLKLHVEGNHLGLEHSCNMCDSKFKLKSDIYMHN